MKILRQFIIIIFISFIGEVLNRLIPYPIPASIYGLLTMLFCLCTKIIKPQQIKDVAEFLIDILPIMFIPAACELIDSWEIISPILVKIIIIIIISTVLVIGSSGITVQFLVTKKETKHERNRENEQ